MKNKKKILFFLSLVITIFAYANTGTTLLETLSYTLNPGENLDVSSLTPEEQDTILTTPFQGVNDTTPMDISAADINAKFDILNLKINSLSTNSAVEVKRMLGCTGGTSAYCYMIVNATLSGDSVAKDYLVGLDAVNEELHVVTRQTSGRSISVSSVDDSIYIYGSEVIDSYDCSFNTIGCMMAIKGKISGTTNTHLSRVSLSQAMTIELYDKGNMYNSSNGILIYHDDIVSSNGCSGTTCYMVLKFKFGTAGTVKNYLTGIRTSINYADDITRPSGSISPTDDSQYILGEDIVQSLQCPVDTVSTHSSCYHIISSKDSSTQNVSQRLSSTRDRAMFFVDRAGTDFDNTPVTIEDGDITSI